MSDIQQQSPSGVSSSSGDTMKRRRIDAADTADDLFVKFIQERRVLQAATQASGTEEEETERIMTEYIAKSGFDLNSIMESSNQSVESSNHVLF